MEAFVLLKLFLSYKVSKAHIVQCRMTDPHPPLQQYLQSGDLLVGGVASLSFNMNPIEFENGFQLASFEDLVVVPKNYQHILALAFAVKEINENPTILPNVSLGFHIYDSYFNARWTYDVTMRLASSGDPFVPNYRCGIHNHLAAVIGGLDSDVSLYIAAMLGTYKIPQLTYGSVPLTKDKSPGCSIYQIAPNEELLYVGIRDLLLHFKWTWVGILTMWDENGERVVQRLSSIFSQHGICIALIERRPRSESITGVSDMIQQGAKSYQRMLKSKANVFVVFGQSHSFSDLRWLPQLSRGHLSKGKVWILSAQMELLSMPYQWTWDTDIIHGALSFMVHSHDLPKFQEFIENRNPSNTKGDGFIRDFWQNTFGCALEDGVWGEQKNGICTGEEKLESLPGPIFEMSMTSHSYSIYTAVYAVAHAIHAMRSLQSEHSIRMNRRRQNLFGEEQWRLHAFLRGLAFNDSAGEKIALNENGELVAGYDLVNWVLPLNQSLRRVKVGTVDVQAAPEQTFTIKEEAITWPSWFNQAQPISVCTDSCHHGSSKKVKEGEQYCCYECIPCPEGKISDQKGLLSTGTANSVKKPLYVWEYIQGTRGFGERKTLNKMPVALQIALL